MSDNEGHCLSKRVDELEAALEEKEYVWQSKYDLLIQDYEQKWGLSMRQAETITALQEQVNNDDEIKASYRETLGKLVPLELEMKKQITALTAEVKAEIEVREAMSRHITRCEARIKELQEALEKIFLCSDAPSCHRIVEQLQAELKQWRDSRDGVMAETEALALKVQELEESRDGWKRQWQLTEARNKAAEDRIKELTEALESIRSAVRVVTEAKDHDLSIDPEWVIVKTQAALGGKK
jgi:chromosome segregation ATPase